MCSMISSQCDERLDERLRRAAQTCRELGKHTTANMFLEAADTILELCDDLQLANAAVQDAEHDESMAWDRVRKAEAENVKLRYKVHVLENGNKWLQILNSSFKANNTELRDFAYDMWNDMNVYYTQHESPDSSDMDFYRDRMRELGVEA